MAEISLFLRFGVAMVIGILIGLQREYAFDEPDRELVAGVRTFALMGLIGCGAGLVADTLGSPWPFVAIIVVLGIFLAISYYVNASKGELGLTTEFAAVLTIMVGALAYWDQLVLAVALGVTMAALLAIKLETRQLARNITREDIFATLKLAIVTAIFLPILPNQNFGPPPFDVFNPYQIWLLVVFISGISFTGYLAIKILGARTGIGLTGFLGGLASSTATTLSFTQRSQTNRDLSKPFALAIVIAWTVMFSRVLVEVAALNIALVRLILFPILLSVAAGAIYCIYLYTTYQYPEGDDEEIEFSNPFQLWPAIKFGLLFAVILLISRAAQVYFGNTGIYLSSILTGLADVDAIALSIAELTQSPSGLDLTIAARAIVFAAVSNTFAKGGIVLLSGARPLRRAILPGYLLMMATGLITAFLLI